MTPQQLNAVIKRYEDVVHNPAMSQEAFLAALTAVKAARASYETMPTAVYSIGTFQVQAGQMLVVDAFGTTEAAVIIPSVKNGTWHAFVGAEAGVHVSLFTYHETVAPASGRTVADLIQEAAWTEVGDVPIDTATCAIADGDAYAPLNVEESGYQIAGVETHLCFSNTANADGSYPVFTQSGGDRLVTAVYVPFADVGDEHQSEPVDGHTRKELR